VVKFDGYGALLLKTGRHVQLRSRRDNDRAHDYPQLQAAGGTGFPAGR
jgi:ATP-dependent DNA ligase